MRVPPLPPVTSAICPAPLFEPGRVRTGPLRMRLVEFVTVIVPNAEFIAAVAKRIRAGIKVLIGRNGSGKGKERVGEGGRLAKYGNS